MRQAVLILGMHRSGTSAIAGVSHLLGAAAPATMMEPAADNPTGFWESETIAGLTKRYWMLAAARGSTPSRSIPPT